MKTKSIIVQNSKEETNEATNSTKAAQTTKTL